MQNQSAGHSSVQVPSHPALLGNVRVTAAGTVHTKSISLSSHPSGISVPVSTLTFCRSLNVISNLLVFALSVSWLRPSVRTSLPASLWNLHTLAEIKALLNTFLFTKQAFLPNCAVLCWTVNQCFYLRFGDLRFRRCIQ